MSDVRIRLDKFLKETRVIPRRTIAKEVVESGAVLINDKTAKPSTLVTDGDLIQIYARQSILTIKVSIEKTDRKAIVKAVVLARSGDGLPKC